MQTPLYLRSLVPGTNVYAWTQGSPWECLDPKRVRLYSWFLCNQVGLQVGCLGGVDVNNFPTLLGYLPAMHTDLFLDAVQIIGLQNTRKVSQRRWDRLSRPRPLTQEPANTGLLTIYASSAEGTFMFDCDRDAKGGWYTVSDIPAGDYLDTFSMWDYKMYVPKKYTECKLPAGTAKRLISSVFDQLFCYDLEDESLKSYLVYAQPIMKSMWESGNNGCQKST